ncbi:MAG: NAD(P)-dependent oxidoreductase [Chthoniobacteraceae bacterium]
MPTLTNPVASTHTCAITGAAGYVGGIIRRKFEAEAWAVRPLTRSPRDDKSVAFQLGRDLPPGALSACDTLIHCAYDFNQFTMEKARAVNIAGAQKLLDAARRDGVKKIVVISSISAFEGCKSVYGKAKLAIEKIALDAGATVVRPGLVFSENGGAMFGSLVAQVEKSSLLPLIGNGGQIQFLIHGDDLAALIFGLGSGLIPAPQGVITAAHDQGWPFRAILEKIAASKNKKVRFLPIPWRLLWLALKTAETLHAPTKFRSDSVVSLVNQNPRPSFSKLSLTGINPRPFHLANEPRVTS